MKFFLALIFLSSISMAHKAHTHGSGEVSLAFEKLKGELEFKAPSDSTVGFEHKARNAKEREQKTRTLDTIRDQIAKMVIFPEDLGCVFEVKSAKIDHEGDHSETEAEFLVQCKKSPAGSTVDFKFRDFFPKLKTLKVQIIIDDLQKSETIKGSKTQVLLK